jgi:photosystem II stability/assembly factor-like uncharacterized protein
LLLKRLVGVALMLAAPTKAVANGAFPDEFSVHFPAGSPATIFIGANFGLLISNDGGATWRYACEPYVTTGSSAPLASYNVGYYQVTPGGTILADSINLTRSTDNGCSWPKATVENVPPNYLTDVFASQADDSLVLGIVSAVNGSSIVRSTDSGATFGMPLYSTSGLLTGVEASRSQPAVAYATEVSSAGVATFLRSEDSGASWTPHDLPIAQNAQPSILAVDPDDENVVYLRVFSGLTDSVVVTEDGGKTFRSLLTINDILRAFLRAGDGTLYTGTINGVLYVRPPGASSFTPRSGPHLRCLGQRRGTNRIYACGDFLLDGYSLGYSDDGAATFHKTMSFTELLGPLTCPEIAGACAAHWARIQGVLGISDGGNPPADAGPPDAGNADGGPSPERSPSPSSCSAAGPGGSWAVATVVLLLSASRSFGRRRTRRRAR